MSRRTIATLTSLVLVLGMGRSGTSLLTGLLSLCGAGLPDDLLAPDAANTKGYFEPVDVLGINERFLKSLGTSWFDTSFRRADTRGRMRLSPR